MSQKILVIDDDPSVLSSIMMILESENYQVITAADGKEGLANLKSNIPDLLILDMMMPKLDGLSVLKTLQQERWTKYRNIPIIILISEDESINIYNTDAGLDMRAEDYIEKPISPDILLDKIRKALLRKCL
jgi:DNA-binding response OmpR family regulator